MKQKLTPWFPSDVKPVRKGVYQQICGLGKDIGYQYWDGKNWRGWNWSAISAKNETYIVGPMSDAWRGLASNPSPKRGAK